MVIAGGVPLQKKQKKIMFLMVARLFWFLGSGPGLSSDATKTSRLMVIQIIMRIEGAGWSSYFVPLYRLGMLCNCSQTPLMFLGRFLDC